MFLFGARSCKELEKPHQEWEVSSSVLSPKMSTKKHCTFNAAPACTLLGMKKRKRGQEMCPYRKLRNGDPRNSVNQSALKKQLFFIHNFQF